jgi:hypothetical protein
MRTIIRKIKRAAPRIVSPENEEENELSWFSSFQRDIFSYTKTLDGFPNLNNKDNSLATPGSTPRNPPPKSPREDDARREP